MVANEVSKNGKVFLFYHMMQNARNFLAEQKLNENESSLYRNVTGHAHPILVSLIQAKSLEKILNQHRVATGKLEKVFNDFIVALAKNPKPKRNYIIVPDNMPLHLLGNYMDSVLQSYSPIYGIVRYNLIKNFPMVVPSMLYAWTRANETKSLILYCPEEEACQLKIV